jgi:hypothetical protein
MSAVSAVVEGVVQPVVQASVGVGGLQAVFKAMFTSSLNPTIGTLSAFTRGDADATVKTFEGLVKDVTADEARFVGARRVENLVTVVTRSGAATILKTASDEWTLDGLDTSPANRASIRGLVGIDISGRDLRGIIELKALAGEAGKDIQVQLRRTTGGGGGATHTITLTDEWQRIATDIPTFTAGSITLDFRLFGSTTNNVTGCFMKQPSLEEYTGQANQNPSEHVSVGAGTSAELATDGGVDDPSAWFLTIGLASNGYLEPASGGIVLSGALLQGLPIPEVGKLYEFIYTRRGTSTTSASSFSFGGHTLAVSNSAGAFIETFVVTAATALTITIFGVTGTLEYDDFSLREIDHGSNADGVKYFETTNPNTVISNIVSTVANAGTNVTSDPDFITTTGFGDPWLAINSARNPSGYFFNTSTLTATITDVLPVVDIVAGQTYGADVTIDQITSGQVQFVVGGTVSDPILTVGTHRIYVTAGTTADPQFAFVGMSGADHIRVSSCSFFVAGDAISDDVLKGVLVEEARTNLQIYSEDLTNTTGWTPTLASVANISSQAPNGAQTVSEITDSGTGVHSVATNSAFATVGSSIYSASYFVEYTDDQYVELFFSNSGGSNGASAIFDILNGTISTAHTVIGTGTADGSSIERQGGTNWFRISVSGSHSGSTSKIQLISNSDGTTFSDSFASTGKRKAFGAMAELGNSPTSYIPTTTASQTRLAETLTYDMPLALSVSVLSKSALVAELDAPDLLFIGYGVELYSATSGDQLVVGQAELTGAEVGYSLASRATPPVSSPKDFGVATAQFNIGLRIDGSNHDHFFDGVKTLVGAFPDVDFSNADSVITIGNSAIGTRPLNGTIKNVQAFATDPTDTEMLGLVP